MFDMAHRALMNGVSTPTLKALAHRVFAFKALCIMLTYLVLISVFMPTVIFAGTVCARFTHNDHDTLILGEIVFVDDTEMVIQSAGFIISAGQDPRDNLNRYLRQEAARQVRPPMARVTLPEWFQLGGFDVGFVVGDYVIASLNIEGDGFTMAWGIHRVDSLDYRTISMVETLSPEISELYTDFVNSRGFGGFFIAVGERAPFSRLPYVVFGIVVTTLAVAMLYIAIKLYKDHFSDNAKTGKERYHSSKAHE